MATTTTNPFLKTLAISITTSSLQKPTSLFIPKSLFFTKPTKQFNLSLQKSTFFTSPFIKRVAQTSEWEQDSSTNAVLDEQVVEEEGVVVEEEEVAAAAAVTWDSPPDVSEPQASGFGTEDGFSQPPEDAKLYVGNLPYDVDSEKLANIFDGAGVVEIAEVIYNRETDRSRGFGFVTMSTVEEADKAVEMFSNYEINGRSLVVNKAAPRGSRPERTERPPRGDFGPSFRVYVGNLPWDVDNDTLEQLFSEHGKVINARVVSDRETGRSRGFGFITMASETEMNDAIAALDGQTLEGRAIRVNVAEERPPRRNY